MDRKKITFRVTLATDLLIGIIKAMVYTQRPFEKSLPSCFLGFESEEEGEVCLREMVILVKNAKSMHNGARLPEGKYRDWSFDEIVSCLDGKNPDADGKLRTILAVIIAEMERGYNFDEAVESLFIDGSGQGWKEFVRWIIEQSA